MSDTMEGPSAGLGDTPPSSRVVLDKPLSLRHALGSPPVKGEHLPHRQCAQARDSASQAVRAAAMRVTPYRPVKHPASPRGRTGRATGPGQVGA